MRWLVLLGWLFFLSGCRFVPAAAADAERATHVSIVWASTSFTIREPDGAAVELRVVLRNRSDVGTESTSIRWDPAFAAAFEVVGSAPAAWRTHTDDSGWGSLDSSGVLPEQTGEYRIWFAPRRVAAPREDSAASPPVALFQLRGELVPEVVPRVEVVSEGTQLVGLVTATPLHEAERRAWRRQQQFERGQIAQVADRFEFVPASGAGAFPAALALASLLLALAGAGICAALAQAARREPEPSAAVAPALARG